ncbi:MAG TPA: alpha-ketoglutarate-dependent dioxygenase AlkB [Thermoanaerobaculia bacterium]|nr:alpha-ketoglutarate-dependent dioxygenase AlkB [Thermoanaerobaculia bacterium]
MRPNGLTYRAAFLTPTEEGELLDRIEPLAFQEVRMKGVVARRTVIHYGFDYDYEGWKIRPTEGAPEWLGPLVQRAAATAGVEADSLRQLMIARYPPGAAIGWHRDAPMFGSPVIGVSLGAASTMKFRRPSDGAKYALLLEPRSLYILDGEARRDWQRSIPPSAKTR